MVGNNFGPLLQAWYEELETSGLFVGAIQYADVGNHTAFYLVSCPSIYIGHISHKMLMKFSLSDRRAPLSFQQVFKCLYTIRIMPFPRYPVLL